MASGEYNKVKVGDQDRKLFRLLLLHKCLTLDLIQRWISPEPLAPSDGKRSNLYFRLNRLKNAGYIKKQALQGYDVYLLEKKGLDEIREETRSSLSLVNFTELFTINHDITVASARFYLESYGIENWVSERELLQHPGELPQVPDGGFIHQGLSVFVEIELSRKSLDRYRDIASIYTAPKGPDRVLYFFQDPSVVEPLVDMTRHHGRVGFFPFDLEMESPEKVAGVCRGTSTTLGQFLGMKG